MPRVLVLSDLHLRRRRDGRVRGVATHAGLVAAVRDARRRGPFARVVVTGDLAQEPAPETYAALREALGSDEPLLLAGNHDRLGPLRAAFPDRPEVCPGSWSFADTVDGWRLLGLDTHWPGHVRGRAGPTQLRWLDAALAADPRPAVLFTHHPPVAVGTRWLDWIGLADAAALAAVLARAGNVRAIVHGHVHMPSEGSFAGARVLGTPSTAFQFVPGSWLPRRGRALAGYRVLELGAGALTSQVCYVEEP